MRRSSPRTSFRAPSVATLLAGLALVSVTACTAEPEQASSTAPAAESSESTSGGTVIQPAGPGEEAETLSPDASVPHAEPNAADVEFVQMMIPHHAQAVRMGELARSRAQGDQVKALAGRIADAQGAEILELSAWLERHGFEAPTAEDLARAARGRHHDVPMMPSMLSQAEMAELAAAQGRRFDVLYLRGMIAHHQGAVDMAGQVMDAGSNTRVGEIAADVSAGQQAEIARMRRLLERISPGQ